MGKRVSITFSREEECTFGEQPPKPHTQSPIFIYKVQEQMNNNFMQVRFSLLFFVNLYDLTISLPFPFPFNRNISLISTFKYWANNHLITKLLTMLLLKQPLFRTVLSILSFFNRSLLQETHFYSWLTEQLITAQHLR